MISKEDFIVVTELDHDPPYPLIINISHIQVIEADPRKNRYFLSLSRKPSYYIMISAEDAQRIFDRIGVSL